MKESSRFVQIPPACARAYTAAVRILKAKLGADAPDFDALIRRELANRDSQMVADDYLEANRERHATSPERAVRIRRKSTKGNSPKPLSTREIIRGYSSSVDPSRN